MKKITGCLTMALLILQNISSAQSFWDSSRAYLSEKSPGDEPVVFAPGRLADTGFWVAAG